MSEKIAARVIADMQVAADRKLAWRIRRLKIALVFLLVVSLTLSTMAFPRVMQLISSQPSMLPSPSYTPPPGSGLQASLTSRRVAVEEDSGWVLYTRSKIDDMQGFESVLLHWYFLYEDDPGIGQSVTFDGETYFAIKGSSSHLMESDPEEYPIMSLSNSCVAIRFGGCASLLGSPHPNPSLVAIAVEDETSIYIVGSAAVPESSEPCEAILGSICKHS